MEIHFYGANCVRLVDKKISMVIDDNLDSLGLKPATKADDVSLFTLDKEPKNIGRFLIDGPGEYEISEVSVKGVPAKAHIDAEGLRSTMYNIEFQGFSVGIIGHVHPDLSDDQLENLGLIDILIIPVGGNGFTLDANGAAQLIKKIEPKIVIPTHYADKTIHFEVPQAELEVFLKEMGISEPEKMNVFKVKDSEFGDKTRVIVLERAS